MYARYVSIESFVGRTISDIENKAYKDGNLIVFRFADGGVCEMSHDQDRCELVYLEDVCGNIQDIIGSPVLLAEEVTNSTDKPVSDNADSWTWTFYKIVTNRGGVTLRWYGESNGYYSEKVDVVEVVKPWMVE